MKIKKELNDIKVPRTLVSLSDFSKTSLGIVGSFNFGLVGNAV
jgi:hypothetical protein